jgi:hypothetical protein
MGNGLTEAARGGVIVAADGSIGAGLGGSGAEGGLVGSGEGYWIGPVRVKLVCGTGADGCCCC